MTATITTHGLIKRFGGKPAVDRLDLKVPSGAVYALLGDNGAGKSTTIRVLTGQLRPDGGSATVLGRDCWRDAVGLRHRVGYVPERPKFYDWMTVEEIGWFVGGFHRDGYRGRYLDLADRLGLGRSAKLKTLSKGGYAKVGLALALAPDPEVLILDEPTSGLDLFTRREFLGHMVDLAGEGRTVLISSHAIAEVERVASHAAFLSEGKLLVAGSLDELRRRFVRLRGAGKMPTGVGLGTELGRTGAGRQWELLLLDPDRSALDSIDNWVGVEDVEESPLTLEEMYLALLGGHRPAAKGANGQPVRRTHEEERP